MIIYDKKQLISPISKFLGLLFVIFSISLSIEYSKYQELVYEEVYETKVEVINIYKKEKYDVLKLKSKNFDFFTSFPKSHDIQKRDLLSIAIITEKIDFIKYLKGFYTNTIYFDKLTKKTSFSGMA